MGGGPGFATGDGRRGYRANIAAGDGRRGHSAAISACKKGEQWEKALALLQEVPEMGLELNSDFHTLVRVASLLGRLEVWDDAVDSALHESVYQRALSNLNHFVQWVLR